MTAARLASLRAQMVALGLDWLLVGSPPNRRYLSEPPLTYRQPEAGAAAGDIGVDEAKKARDAKRAAGKSSWRDYVPWL